MHSRLVEKMNFSLEPVAIYFTDGRPENAIQLEVGKRGCVASMLVASAKGKTVVFDNKTYGCPGGGVGLCFGDTYAKENHPTKYLLSTGDKEFIPPEDAPDKSLGIGERFFASPELAAKWKQAFPFTETETKYVVFKPLSKVDENALPDLIHIFANPDQLSALVIMSGFNRGDIINTVAPFVSACQSITIAYQEIDKQFPKGVIGFFDISQRRSIPKELLSYTVPYGMYRDIEGSVDESCLTTESWERIAKRFQ